MLNYGRNVVDRVDASHKTNVRIGLAIDAEAERIGEGYDVLRARLAKGGGLQALETQMVREKSLDLITSIANIQKAE